MLAMIERSSAGFSLQSLLVVACFFLLTPGGRGMSDGGTSGREESAPSLRARWEMPPRCTPFDPPRIKDLREELRQTGYRLVIAIHPKHPDRSKGESPARDLFIIDADGTGLRRFTKTPREDERLPRTSPNGSMFTYSGGRYLVDLNTLETREIRGGYTWTPDSRRLVECSSRGIIYTDILTGKRSKPVPVPRTFWCVDLSKDGKWFIFEIRDYLGVRYTIDFMSADGRSIRKMPNHPIKAGECHPAFSPDGKWMCWNAGKSLSIRRFDPSLKEGTRGEIVTMPKGLLGQDPCGRWSHCGRYIAYVKIPHSGSWKAHSPLCIVRVSDNAAITISPPGWIGHHWDYDWLPPEEPRK